jgi:histidinol-phosphate/aromatic aminotransferase/cobyric acid decarboxylase-like protein
MSELASVPAAGAHGGDGARLATALGIDPAAVLDLSASLNPVALAVGPLVSEHLDTLTRYPDPTVATKAMAAALGVDPERVLLTNGGAEAIALVAAEMGEGWVDDPDFSLYRRHLPSVRLGAPRWRSNPHNPTGALASVAERADVWDEAFYPLATGGWSSGAAESGAIVLGSLTKVFACPGLRLGYVLGPVDQPDLMRRLADRQPRWSVNGLALDVLPELLERADLMAWTDAIGKLRGELIDLLVVHGLTPQPSSANYVLVGGSAGLRDRLAPLGVVVRDCTSFGLPEHVRIAVPDADGLARLATALEIVIGGGRQVDRIAPAPGGSEK